MVDGKQVLYSRNGVIVVLAVLILLGTGLVFWPQAFKPETASPAQEDGGQIALGRSIYNSQCAACHGVNLEGQPNWRTRKANGRLPAPQHDETGHTWHHDDATLFNLTKYGLAALVGQPVETDMPAYDGVLTDDQIRAVLAYIKSRWPEHIRHRQKEMTERAVRKAGS